MADNFTPDTDTDVAYAADEIAAVKHMRMKAQFGEDGSATDVSATNPMPVGGSGAAALGKAIDSSAGATDVGVPLLAVRDDALGALTPAEGDWVPVRVDASGYLWSKLGSNSGTVIGDVNVITAPADDRTTDSQSVALALDALMNDHTAVTPSYAVIDAASSGDNTLVTATASQVIVVHSLFLVAAGTVNVRFESGAGGTALTGQMNLVANTGFVLPFNPVGWFRCGTNTLLNLELSGAVSVDGSLQYTKIAA